jgi:hypothetical protein
MENTEVILAFGHENIKALHNSTLEITKERHLSKQGDCIVAVAADKGLVDLNPEFKEILLQNQSRITIIIEAGGIVDCLYAFGDSRLILSHPTDMVLRKSSYVCDRTLAIKASKAAGDLSRQLLEELKKPKQDVKITFKAIV